MNKKTLLEVWLVALIALAGAGVLDMMGVIPPWLAGAVIVIAFPVFALFLCLWWMAPDRAGDIPFIGY